MIFAHLKRFLLRGITMKKLLALAIASIFVIAAFASEADAWRRGYRKRQRTRYQSYTIKNPDRFKGCQTSCEKKYGKEGATCKELPLEEKKACRQKSRSCNAKCWNKYH
jgi:hypothetical protein